MSSRKMGNGVLSDLISGVFGLGKKKRRAQNVRRKRVGRGVFDTIKKGVSGVHRFVKDNRLISRGLRHFLPREQALANFAEHHGYGRRMGSGCAF